MKVTIIKQGINGEGIAYYKKQPLFIDGSLRDEIVDVEIDKTFPTFRTATITNIEKKSTHRIQPACKYIDRCKACTLMHVDYKEQLNIKKEILTQAIKKYTNIDTSIITDVIENDQPLAYRNSLKLPFQMKKNEIVCGMYEKNSNFFVDIKECIIHNVTLDSVKRKILKVLNKHRMYAYSNQTKDGLRYMVLRGFEGKYQLTLVSGNTEFSEKLIEDILNIKEIVSFYQSINPTKKTVEIFGNQTQLLGGNKKLNFHFMDFKISLLPRSFFQLNTLQAEKLYKLVDDEIDEVDILVEAYSGVGIMSLLAAKKVKQVIGVESIKDAVNNARNNAKQNDIHNVDFRVGDAGRELVKISKQNSIDVLLVDPPRSGLDETMLECILNSDIKKIIYVSCNPSTLAKNIHSLSGHYKVEKIVPLDMFSNTAHVESVSVLIKK